MEEIGSRDNTRQVKRQDFHCGPIIANELKEDTLGEHSENYAIC